MIFSILSKRCLSSVIQVAKGRYTTITYQEAVKAQNELEETLLKIQNVVSIAVQKQNGSENFYIHVGLEKPQPDCNIPKEFVIRSEKGDPKSIPIQVKVIGEITAQAFYSAASK